MWEKVEARKHTVHKVFPASFTEAAGEQELMLFGSVEYKLKAGGQDSVDWAGYAHLVKDDGAWKFQYYRVYIQR